MAPLVKATARQVAVFDASGKEDLRCLVVAGFVSASKDWQAFHEAWTKRLATEGLKYFHMSEFAHSTGQFKDGWKGNRARRDSVLFGVNYFFALTTTISPYRVDSSLLLPYAPRCLMKNVTRPNERDAWQIEEATERDNKTGTD